MLNQQQIGADQVRALRTEIRNCLQHELATLMCLDRPRVRAQLESDGEPLNPSERAVSEAELNTLNERIIRVRGYLARLHEPGHSVAARTDGAVLVDLGDGPQLTLLAELPIPEVTAVVPVDSPLGLALLGAAAGDTVHYPTPHGARSARVLAVEA